MIAVEFWGVKARKSQHRRNFASPAVLKNLFALYRKKLYEFRVMC
jgi:hypothetical protein